MASVSGAQTSRPLLDILPQLARSKIEVGSVRLKPILGVTSIQSTSSRFPKLEECAHFHYDHVELPSIQLNIVEETGGRGDFEGVTLEVKSGLEKWQIHRTYLHFCKLDEQLHQCVFDRKFSQLPILKSCSPKTQEETRILLNNYVRRLSAIGSGCAISCGPVLTWIELDNRGRRLVSAGNGINTPAVAAAFATATYTAHANDELSFQTGDMISVIDMPPAEESAWWRGKRGFVVGFFPSNCVAVITDKIPNEIALVGPTKPVLRKHGKLIAFFRAFILSRPSRRRLKQSGILKERVFGCDLSEHLLNSCRQIPLVLKCCADFIEAHGIVDGIYRLSGVTSNIQRLRSTFDEDRVPVLTEDSGIRQDIHSVASLLKMYFRELPNPLCTYQLYDEFVAAVQSPIENRLENMKRVVQKLPPPHYRTLEYLMGHLGRVCGHSLGTGMTARNVAIVWAPNLLRCKSLDQGVAALQGVGVQAVVTEFLILYGPQIFGQTGSESRSRPKSLAVSTPTKLLPLHEAQKREQLSPSKSEIKNAEIPLCYHTVLELPRKRQTLTWKAIFTPLRSTPKSSRRIKHKNVVKSAEYLGVAKAISLVPQGSIPSSSTHSRSVSHDSYFDTAVIEQASSSSLMDSQHEGMSLSLDLSELQMNFELEESEMKIFSEDETNQLFSSGTSIAFGPLYSESNLEERFSNQELRYIDSYSPDPLDSPSEDPVTPGYQQLISPNSYENLKVCFDTRASNESGSPSKKSDSSPYAYKELSESSVTMEDIQRKENDLYECSDNNNVVKRNSIYDSLEISAYEPVTVSSTPCSGNIYQNEDVANQMKSEAEDSNIYEVVEMTPSEIYEQVSYFKNSVEELNRLVEDTKSGSSDLDEAQILNTFSTSQEVNSGILLEDDLSNDYENITEGSIDKDVNSADQVVYEKVEVATSQELEEYHKQAFPTIIEKKNSDLGNLESVDSPGSFKTQGPTIEIMEASMESSIESSSPEKIIDIPIDSNNSQDKVPEQYECVEFSKVEITEGSCGTECERDNFNIKTDECDTLCEMKEISNVNFLEKEKPNKIDIQEAVCDNVISYRSEVKEESTIEKNSILTDNRKLILENNENDKTNSNEVISKDCNKSLVKEGTSLSSKTCFGREVLNESHIRESKESNKKSSLSLNLRKNITESDGSCCKKNDKLKLISETIGLDGRVKDAGIFQPKANESVLEKNSPQEQIKLEQDSAVGGSLRKEDGTDKGFPQVKEEERDITEKKVRKLSLEESEAERRERIEKYKEERRSFFRNKYKTDNIAKNDEDDDELIRRIKQKTKLMDQRGDSETELVVVRRRSVECPKRSPSKTTVTISYSPTRTKISLTKENTAKHDSTHSGNTNEESGGR